MWRNRQAKGDSPWPHGGALLALGARPGDRFKAVDEIDAALIYDLARHH